MTVVIILLLLLLLVGAGGFALHVLWYLLVGLVLIWAVGVLARSSRRSWRGW